MTEKQYRLNKWGTRLLKNNRPLFDWTNEADDIVDLLNDLADENEQLKTKIKREIGHNQRLYKDNCELTKENEQLKSLNQYLIELLEQSGATVEIEHIKGDVE